MFIVSEKDAYGTVTEKVPFLEGAEVTFALDISAELAAHWRQVVKKTIKDEKITEKLFNALVKDWSFGYINENREQVKVPVTVDGMEKYLSARIQNWITKYMQDFLMGKGKD